jgi:hypothetical protein
MSDQGEDGLAPDGNSEDSPGKSDKTSFGKFATSFDIESVRPDIQFPKIDAAAWFPSAQLVDALLPQLKLALQPVNAALEDFAKSFADSITGPLNTFLEQHRSDWQSLFEGVRKAVETWLPPNWQGVHLPSDHLIETILLDEGIPLAWVPSAELLTALLGAPDGAARRRIIGRRWRRLVSDCEAALAEMTSNDLHGHCVFASDIVRALREGHEAAAQALAANLLDSIIRHNVDLTLKQVVSATGRNRTRMDLDDYQLKAALALAPIWRAYEEFWEHKGDPVPRVFGRHPSAHAVSRMQYSRVNAVIALMLVTSLLRLLDEGIGRNRLSSLLIPRHPACRPGQLPILLAPWTRIRSAGPMTSAGF